MKNEKSTSDQINNDKLKKLDKNAIIIGGIGIFFLFGFTIVATQFHLWFDFNNTGQIGDTVGGLTNPIIGIFSALLIYLTFRAQIQANYIVQSQIDRQQLDDKKKKEFEQLMAIYNHLKESFDNFQYKDGGDIITGGTAFHKFWSLILTGRDTVQHGSQKSFESIIKLFEIIVDKFEISKNNNIDIELVLFLTELQFNQFIWESYRKSKMVNSASPSNSNLLRVMVDRINTIEMRISELKK